MTKRAVVLLSGGLDSATCVAVAIDQGFEVVALSFRYGQRHSVELEAAERIREHYKIQRSFVCDVGIFHDIGGSALTDSAISVPRARSPEEMAAGIPVTYVPARNLVFLSYAVGIAETSDAPDIFIGVNAIDYSGYPDCRPEFIRSFQETANLATKASVEGTRFRVHSPLIDLSKAEIIRLGTRLDVPFGLTHSCYSPDEAGLACDSCDSCVLRRQGFAEAFVPDPTRYSAQR